MHAKNVNEICYICFNFPLKEIYVSFKTAVINMVWNINSEIENFAIQAAWLNQSQAVISDAKFIKSWAT